MIGALKVVRNLWVSLKFISSRPAIRIFLFFFPSNVKVYLLIKN